MPRPKVDRTSSHPHLASRHGESLIGAGVGIRRQSAAVDADLDLAVRPGATGGRTARATTARRVRDRGDADCHAINDGAVRHTEVAAATSSGAEAAAAGASPATAAVVAVATAAALPRVVVATIVGAPATTVRVCSGPVLPTTGRGVARSGAARERRASGRAVVVRPAEPVETSGGLRATLATPASATGGASRMAGVPASQARQVPATSTTTGDDQRVRMRHGADADAGTPSTVAAAVGPVVATAADLQFKACPRRKLEGRCNCSAVSAIPASPGAFDHNLNRRGQISSCCSEPITLFSSCEN